MSRLTSDFSKSDLENKVFREVLERELNKALLKGIITKEDYDKSIANINRESSERLVPIKKQKKPTQRKIVFNTVS